MKNILKILLTFLIVSQLGLTINAQRKKEFNKSYDKKDKVKISTVLGDCKVEKSTDDKIHVNVKYTYNPDIYEIYVNEGSNSLNLEEEFDDNNPRGYSLWSVSLPDSVILKVESATGNYTFDGLDIELDANSGTGNINVRNCSGEFELNSGTGNLYVVESKGEFDMNSGTGNLELQSVNGKFELNSGTGYVEADDITFEDRSKLNSGTGDVIVRLAANLQDDLELNSGTGDAELDMNGIELNGYFELSCNEDSGRVKCPVEAERERIRRRHGNDNLVYSFSEGDGSARIKISTGSGTAELSL